MSELDELEEFIAPPINRDGTNPSARRMRHHRKTFHLGPHKAFSIAKRNRRKLSLPKLKCLEQPE